MNRPTVARRRALAICGAFVLIAALGSTTAATAGSSSPSADEHPSPAAPTPKKITTLASGVTYSAYNTTGPNKVKIITVDPTIATLDVALAGSTIPNYVVASKIASSHKALAAVNGDFGIEPGRPGHLYAQDGKLIQTSVLNITGKNFAVSSTGEDAWIDTPKVSITAMQLDTSTVTPIDHWNQGQPANDEVNAFSQEGGSLERPMAGCGARLIPAAEPAWNSLQSEIYRDYTVDSASCTGTMSVGNAVVLLAKDGTTRGDIIKGLTIGETVRLSWGLGWSGVVDSMGGSPVILKGGVTQIRKSCRTYLCSRNPRTAVGIKADGKIMLVQVDGLSKTSVGMTLYELAKEMKAKGAVDALNLDGGGSSTMWIKGKGVVNSPSDGKERVVSSVLMVLTKPDPGDPGTLVTPRAVTGVPFVDQQISIMQANADRQAALEDPGSTGGLLDHLEEHGVALPNDLSTDVDRFHEAQS